MDTKSYKTLEFDKMVAQLVLRANCCVSRERAEELAPMDNIEEVERALTMTAEAETLLYRTGATPVDDFPDMRECLKRIKAALFFNPKELLDIYRCLRAARQCREQLVKEDSSSMLSNLASCLSTHRSVEEEISRCIVSEDEIFDGASPALSRIRRAMRLANEKVRDRLNSMIHSSSFAKYLQEPIITIRNGRFVIPVKQEYRSNVPGLIHDQSGSGATLFIEPTAVVDIGNELKKLISEEQEEIERILSELTAMIEPYAEEILDNISIMGDIDLVFAKARLSREYGCVQPKLNEKGYIRIVSGRHPLISADSVVPIDIWMGRDFRTLIITGPNTGGKTVTLKTVGLFTLMAQAGMFVPAAEGTELSVFCEVFADIGDEQSIEQSLSTFSSHMKNIVGILDRADDRSLVLLDELGAGTDPVEGAALAMSILTELHERGCLTAATTHYSEIKAFALTNEGMENASMEFDIDRLCPTYRLFIGIPGKSNAFEISKRLGLSDGVIDGAKRFLKHEDVAFEDIISSAQSQHRIAEEERRLAAEAREELEKLRAEARTEHEKLEADKEKQKQKAREEARRIVAEAKRDMEKLVVQIRSLKDIDRSAADREIQRSRDELRAKEGELAEPMPAPKKDDSQPLKTVVPGQTVRVVTLDQNATVLKKPDDKREVLIQAGIIKLTVPLSDLREEQESGKKQAKGKSTASAPMMVSLELDIRGMQVADAIPIVDRYLSDADMVGRSEVNVIHGKGTGALRAGIQEHLRRHPLVKSFRIGNYGEGDAGVTVITLKK